MDLLKKLKELLLSKDKKKLRENTVIVIIVGIILIIAGSSFLSGKGKPAKQDINEQSSETVETAGSYSQGSNETELKMKNILSQVEGAGKVEVMITYLAGKEDVPAYDTKKNENSTDEKDSGGGTRKITQNSYDSTVVFKNGQNGEKNPVILKELEPVVKGVLVVAEGASNPQVREKLVRSVQVLLDVPAHRIQVVERKK